MESEPAPALYFKQVLAGPMQNFVYLIGDPRTREAAVVDAAWDVGRVLDIAREDGYRVSHALVTHTHPDHVGGSYAGMEIEGLAALLEKQPVKIVIHKSEADFLKRFTGVSDTSERPRSSSLSTRNTNIGIPASAPACRKLDPCRSK